MRSTTVVVAIMALLPAFSLAAALPNQLEVIAARTAPAVPAVPAAGAATCDIPAIEAAIKKLMDEVKAKWHTEWKNDSQKKKTVTAEVHAQCDKLHECHGDLSKVYGCRKYNKTKYGGVATGTTTTTTEKKAEVKTDATKGVKREAEAEPFPSVGGFIKKMFHHGGSAGGSSESS